MNGSSKMTEERLWALAEHVASRSTCSRRKVGALGLSNKWGLITTGHNREITGERCDRGHCPRGRLGPEECPPYSPYDNCIARHAEIEAYQPEVDVMYVTEEPCDDCASFLSRRGVRVVVRDG